MLKISVIDGLKLRRLILEGKLVAPWADELKAACDRARGELDGRDFVVDLKHLTAISEQGENVLLELMNEGVRLRSDGVFTKQVLKRLARRIRGNSQEPKR